MMNKVMNAMGNISDRYILEACSGSADLESENNIRSFSQSESKNRNGYGTVKKSLAIVATLFIVFLIAISVNPDIADEISPDLSVTESTGFYVDTTSDAGFDYKFCYSDESMTGNIGIADSNGSIILNPHYVSVLPIKEGRFIARKFVDGSPYSALVDENAKELIPFFRGEIRVINNIRSEDIEPVLSVEPFSENHRFTDPDGNKIISQEFRSTGFRSDGLFYGKTDNEYFFFESNGKLLLQIAEGETKDFRKLTDNYTLLIKHCGKAVKFGLSYKDNIIIPCEYDELDIVSDSRIVARIGDEYGVEPTDIVRIFDNKGNQLSNDGEFNSVYFEENAGYGIATKFIMTENDIATACWIIDSQGKKVSEVYDSIRKSDNGKFFGTAFGVETEIVLQ